MTSTPCGLLWDAPPPTSHPAAVVRTGMHGRHQHSRTTQCLATQCQHTCCLIRRDELTAGHGGVLPRKSKTAQRVLPPKAHRHPPPRTANTVGFLQGTWRGRLSTEALIGRLVGFYFGSRPARVLDDGLCLISPRAHCCSLTIRAWSMRLSTGVLPGEEGR